MSDERLSNLESKVASVQTTLGFHGQAHKDIADNVKAIDVKVDSILLQLAEKTGESKAAKKVAATISALISVLISLAIAYFQS